MKTYRTQYGIGKTRYSVSKHNGVQTHPDGSPFFDIALFTNRKKRDAYVRELRAQGYTAA